MSEEIIKILNDLAQRFGIIIDWSDKNIVPYLRDLIERIVDYEIVTSIIWIVISVLMILLSVRWIKLDFIFCFKDEDEYTPEEIMKTILFCFGVFFLILSIIIFITQIFDLIKCFYLPEKILYDFINKNL